MIKILKKKNLEFSPFFGKNRPILLPIGADDLLNETFLWLCGFKASFLSNYFNGLDYFAFLNPNLEDDS